MNKELCLGILNQIVVEISSRSSLVCKIHDFSDLDHVFLDVFWTNDFLSRCTRVVVKGAGVLIWWDVKPNIQFPLSDPECFVKVAECLIQQLSPEDVL